jgi:hypothetical protein
MLKADDYRQRARVFLEMARNAADPIQAASCRMIAADYFERADQLERDEPPKKRGNTPHSN